MVFYIVGTIISIIGFIAGIITGASTHNFLFCLLAWISTFLYAIIYFGIGIILEKNNEILDTLNILKNTSYNSQPKTNEILKPKANEWKCKSCGRINQNYVGSCGCGMTKDENEKM